MEIWFWSAVAGAIFAGLSNFFFKQAAHRGYNAEVFVLLGSLNSVLLGCAVLIFFPRSLTGYGVVGYAVLLAGLFSAMAGILKIQALRYIDSTIYFPLFKLLAPLIAILAGVILFAEVFTTGEWIGMLLGLLVPLMLITKSENHRQNNLVMGLLLVLVTGVISASVAIVGKYAIDNGVPVVITMLYTVLGVGIGSFFSFAIKKKFNSLLVSIKQECTRGFVVSALMRSTLIYGGVWGMLFAYAAGGTLAVVQTIHSMYILIPIVLAIIVYNEHWNLQKVVAIVLSVASLALLG